MLSANILNQINSRPDLEKKVTDFVREYLAKAHPENVFNPSDLDCDVYLEGVLQEQVFHVDLNKSMLRKYVKPLTIECGNAKYVELYGRIHLQQKIKYNL
jgi:hypothetical protein